MTDVGLNWAVLAVSFFNTILLFWLGLMVLLVGNRCSAGVWLTAGGLLLGALFFTSHSAILGRGLASTSFGMDFWWWVSWMPAITAPLAWYGAMLWHSGYRLDRPHPHHAGLAVSAGMMALIVYLLLFANPLPSYQYVAGREILNTPGIGGIPLLVLAYLGYSLFCYLLPLDLLRRQPVGEEFPVPLSGYARQRARPWLATASLALLLAGIILSWTALWALTTHPLPSLSQAWAARTVLRFDLAVELLVGLAVVLLGRAVVGFEVFTGRSLPRDRFFRHWRSTVILAGGFGAVASWALAIELRPIYSLMLAIALMTLFYALYSWRAFAEREEFFARLRPFVTSQNLYRRLTEPERAGEDDSSRALFEALCRAVLEVRRGALLPAGSLAAFAGPPLVYPRGDQPALPAWQADWQARMALERRSSAAHCFAAEPLGIDEGWAWVVPLWAQSGAGDGADNEDLCGLLLLGEKSNQGIFSEEEIEFAQAAGERLLDLLAGAEMARLSLDLLRQRLSQNHVLEGQGRRVLHDEVLPELHTAILTLGGAPSATPEGHQAVQILSAVHRRIADLMRELPLSTPTRLAQGGLAAALHTLVEKDFGDSFNDVLWEFNSQAVQRAREIPLFAAEVIYFAARELIRNSARYGRGGDSDRRLCLRLSLWEEGEKLHLAIEDDGVGIRPPSSPEAAPGNGRVGSGLRIHTAMLTAIGANITVMPLPGGGTRGHIVYGG